MNTVSLFIDYINIIIQDNYIFSFLILFLFLVVYNTLAIPGNIILMVATGYFFSLYLGFLICISSLTISSFIFFLFAKKIFKIFIPSYVEKYSSKAKDYIKNSSLEYLILFRIIPGPPLFLQNLILSFLNIDKVKFIISSLIGFTPTTIICVYIGHQINNFNNIKSITFSKIFSFDFFLLLFFIGVILFVRIIYLNKKK